MVTYSTLRDALMKECGRQTTDTAAAAIFLEWMQEAVDDIVATCPGEDFMKMSETIPTVDATVSYSLQVGVTEVLSMSHADGTRIIHIPHAEMVRRGYDLTETGKPSIWYDDVYDESTARYKIKLFRIPDGVYSLTLVERRNTKIIAAGDNCFLPQRYIPALKDYVRWHFNLRDGSPQRAIDFERQYQIKVGKAAASRPSGRRIILGEMENDNIYLGDDFVDFWNP